MNKQLFCLFIIFFLSNSVSAKAEELDAAVTWSCRPEQGMLVINYYPSLADARPDVLKQHPLVFYSLLKVRNDKVVGSRSKKVSCRLKTDKIEVTFEPGVPNVNLLGRCGAEITGEFSIMRNGVPLITEEPFENLNCHERERRIDAVTIRDGSANPEIRYGIYDQ